MKGFKKIAKKAGKWLIILAGTYWVVTTFYFGYSDVDEQKGVYNFYWSGLNALFRDDKAFGFKRNESFETQLDGRDGPYVFGNKRFVVDSINRLVEDTIDRTALLPVSVANEDNDLFHVSLKKSFKPEPDYYPLPSRIIAISDIEGNYDALYSFLLNNKVIDRQYNWIFGEGHLVLNGDFVDRGENVTQVLWLIYQLEEQAEKAGGKLHYILGNHEIMNLYGDVSYADFKYMEAAKRISGEQHWDKAMRHLLASHSELGKWLRTKNVVEKIGDYLFVHAGLKTELLTENLSVQEINAIARKYYGVYPDKRPDLRKERLVLGSYHSPYWDRSLSMNLMYRLAFLLNDPLDAPLHKTTQEELEKVLHYYGATKMVVGHSVVDDITADYQGKVFKIDVKHGKEKNSGLTKGLLIEDGNAYKIDDLGKRQKL